MPNYPKVNYIGNKEKLTEWIISNLPMKEGVVLDLFSGGASVSYALKKQGYRVIANDILYSNFVINKAIIENKDVVLDENIFDMEINKTKIEDKYNTIKFLSNELYFDNEVYELAKLLCISDLLQGYEKYMFLSLLRRAMIRKLPYSRMNVPWNQIVKLRDEEYSYQKYGRKRAYHNLSFQTHMQKNIKNYNDAVFNNGQDNLSYNIDSSELMKLLEKSVDIVYMDPPYPKTMNKYFDFYGKFDEMFGKHKPSMDLCNTQTFLSNFREIIENCVGKTKFVVISLSNRTVPTVAEITMMLSNFGNVSVISKEHQYKVTGKENKNSSCEELIILKMNE